jgi:hypothetical protein
MTGIPAKASRKNYFDSGVRNLLHKIKALNITVGLLNIFDNNCRSILVDCLK